MRKRSEIEIGRVDKEPLGGIRVDDDRVRLVTGSGDEGEGLCVGAQGERIREGQLGLF